MANGMFGLPERLKRLAGCESGNVAMIFGVCILPLMGAVGLAIDFGNVMAARTKAQMATDAAVLQAAGIARDLIKAGDGSALATNAAIDEAKQRAQALFKAHSDQAGLPNPTFTVDIVRTGLSIKATGSFSITSANYFGKIFQQSSFKSAGSAQSAASLPNYVDVYLLMDVSQSMGLAATSDDMQKLYTLTKAQTPEGCTFGCHVIKSNYPSSTPSNETIAHNNGVRLRVDVMRDAVGKMIDDAQSSAAGDSVYRFGIYTMGLNAAKTAYSLNEVSAISGNYSALKLATNGIDLSANNDGSGVGDSYVNEQLSALDLKVPDSGDGSSQSNSRKYVFLITDGVRDVKGSCTSGHCVRAIDPSYCSPFKTNAASVTVGVLYTTYLPIYNTPNNPASGLNGDYAGLVYPIRNDIAPALSSCASPNWYFEASDEAGISAAFDKMFSQTSNAPALTD